MNKNRLINTIAAAVLAVSTTGMAQAASLLEIYQQALQSDPLIHEAESRRLAAMEANPQARGLLFPQIQGSASVQTSESDGNQFVVTDAFVGAIPFEGDSDDKNWNINLRQSIFRWDQVVGLQQANKRVAQARSGLRSCAAGPDHPRGDALLRRARRGGHSDVNPRGPSGDRAAARTGAPKGSRSG